MYCQPLFCLEKPYTIYTILDRGSQTYYFKRIICFILFYDLQNEMGHTTTEVDFKFSTYSQQPQLGLTLTTRAKKRLKSLLKVNPGGG